MKSSMKRFADDAASNSRTECGLRPMRLGSAPGTAFLHTRSSKIHRCRFLAAEINGHRGKAATSSRAASRATALRLVEEAAALQQAGALFRGDLDVARRQQENLVGYALHATV